MPNRLFLLDGMALAYRAHFAFATRPIRTSAGTNTSALFGFINTLLDILQSEAPTHVAVAFDTEAPTARHTLYPEYKAQRQAMPEDLSFALPHLRRCIAAFHIPALVLDGYEADDLIGTVARRAEAAGFETFMVTPDKDFGQLVTASTRLWKPGRQGGDKEILGPAEIRQKWGIERVDQVVDMLALMGDATDNIPGVPGIGEKTAARLLARYGSVEGVLDHAQEVGGKIGAALQSHREDALLSRKLATIDTAAPIALELGDLALRPHDEEALRAFCQEFEFNAIGRRLFGPDFKAGRVAASRHANTGGPSPAASPAGGPSPAQGDLFAPATPAVATPPTPAPHPGTSVVHRTIADVPHAYQVVDDDAGRTGLVRRLRDQPAFCFDTETDGLDPRTARLVGIALSCHEHEAWYLPIADAPACRDGTTTAGPLLDLLPLFTDPRVLKVGHNLKFDLLVLRAHGVPVAGPFFDTMIAHALLEPELRHGMDYLAEALLDYSPIPIERLIGPKGSPQKSMADVPLPEIAEYSAEDADVTWQLYRRLAPEMQARGLQRVMHDVEMPVLPALVAMEHEGIRVDADFLRDYSQTLASEMAQAEADIQRLAGVEFNVNSNRQLGEILFDRLRLVEKPKKTPTGQYATDEQTLLALADAHEIVRRLLDYRTVSKLRSTYAEALPAAISAVTGRVHTTYHQAATATGRLSSADPNLQNIPIRTERGQEIRRAFVARPGWLLLSADYSQIELRIIAALSREEAMIEAFRRGEDIHTATAARVFSVDPGAVTPEMRRRAKMVNFGIAYGISAFGLAQRLAIPRADAADIIQHYFQSYPGIRAYMDATIESARQHGYVETLTGRRRYLRDIHSANATTRGAAERNAINTPIQGTAADMIKIAMGRIQAEIEESHLASRLLLQVHDELVFDLLPEEQSQIVPRVVDLMRHALPLPGGVPVEVETGTGRDWVEAH